MADLQPHRGKTWTSAVLVAVGTFALMAGTGPSLAITWDEGHVLGREARVRWWFQAMRDPAGFSASWTPPAPGTELVPDSLPPPDREAINTRSKLLSPAVLAWFWPFAREEPHGHPPFYAIVGLIGDLVAPGLAELPRARIGPMIVFSLAAGAIFAAFHRRGGPWPAVTAASAWVLQPNLFGMGHYAGYDAILASLWVGAILAFARAVEPRDDEANDSGFPRWGWAVVFGVLCGWAADTKLTGWFLPLPFLAWAALARSRRGALALVVGGLVAAVTLYAFNPAWWASPVVGPREFFRSNLSRAETITIPVLFLGRVYLTPRGSLPWYNTLVWTAIVTPVGFLVLAILGAVRAYRGREPLAMLALGHWGFLLALRAMPHTPGHDGVRQFLPAFGCLALVAGFGAEWAVRGSNRWGKLVAGSAILEGAISVAVMMPVPLSYFSPIVGGLPGAARIGMEPTYFWDALSAEAIDRLALSTPPGRTVRFATFSNSWLHLKRTGAMPFGVFPIDPGPPSWYVVQNRPGQFGAIDHRLIGRLGPRSVLVEKFGVPLIWAFPYEDVRNLRPRVSGARGD